MQGRKVHLRLGNTCAQKIICVCLAATFVVTAASLRAGAEPSSVRTSALPPDSEGAREADPPLLLTGADAERYRRIVARQQEGDWEATDREIGALKDRMLLGAVEAQRYLHKAYRTSYGELARWLVQYAAEPDAKAIYALALKRRPPGVPAPHPPVIATLTPHAMPDEVAVAVEHQPLSGDDLRRAQLLRAEIRVLALLEPRKAELALAGGEAHRLLEPGQIDGLRTAIAAGHAASGNAMPGAGSSMPAPAPASAEGERWHAGLAAWRLGRFDDAGRHFQAAARNASSPWPIAAAAFWAARVEIKARRPARARYWLGLAAEHPRTFYGVLARRTLGIDSYFDFDTAPFTEVDAELLAELPAGRRALAFLQVGDTRRAEAELRALVPHAPAQILEAVVALADRANMPGLTLQLAGYLADHDGRNHDHALYPVPRWRPIGGFTVDRALLFAVMRQESQFLPHVQSNAGAVGLMQLMPATAAAMAERTGMPLERRKRHHAPDPLAEPEYNMTLAQEYISMLLADDHINGNLVLLAAAYNGGPGAVQRWVGERELMRDPLLFIESIPTQQTRIFTERVLANYWIYRQRLSQPSPDLDALAAGRWPTYTALDVWELDGRHAENR
ncbi:MAG TPA: lytic transglycosylase domain-containing protein [Stellaceae bacterium]|nr:lytic transglycosylase domain-containing protein [Stellaceae bacterium]